MGNAVITENIGDSLYKIRLVYDTDALVGQIAGLEAVSLAYWRELNQALDHLKLLRRDRAMNKEVLDALVQQWKDILEQKTQWPPEEIIPEEADPDGFNPNTGEPYTADERNDALAEEAVDKINTARVAAGLTPLVRSVTLDQQSLSRIEVRSEPVGVYPDFVGRDGYLEMLARQQSIQENGKTIHDSFLQEAPGVVFDSLEEFMLVGQTSSSEAVDALRRNPDVWDKLMDADAAEIGARYRYNPAHPGTHIWNVVAAKPRAAPAGNSAFFATEAGIALTNEIEAALGPTQATALSQGMNGGSGGGGSGGGNWGEPWKAENEYSIGAQVMGTRKNNGGHVMARTRSKGLSGTEEPDWPSLGADVVDGQIVWTVMVSNLSNTTATLVNAYYHG